MKFFNVVRRDKFTVYYAGDNVTRHVARRLITLFYIRGRETRRPFRFRVVSLTFTVDRRVYVAYAQQELSHKITVLKPIMSFITKRTPTWCRLFINVKMGPGSIGVGAQSTLGARHFCPKNMYEKLTKCPNFT